MDLGEILRVMRSRWYIVVPMLLLAVGLGVGAYIMVPAKYSTYTMVSLLSSPSATTTATPGQDNPFLDFNDSLTATADFLGRGLQSTDVVQELRREGVTEDYTVALAENAQGPFLTLTVTGTDEDHILTSASTLARYAATELVEIQQQNGVATKDMIRLAQVIPPQKPETQTKKKIEIVIAAGGGTVALTFILTFALESIRRSPRRRASDRPEPTETAADNGARPADRSSWIAGQPDPVVRGNADVGAETKVIQTSTPPAKSVPVMSQPIKAQPVKAQPVKAQGGQPSNGKSPAAPPEPDERVGRADRHHHDAPARRPFPAPAGLLPASRPARPARRAVRTGRGARPWCRR